MNDYYNYYMYLDSILDNMNLGDSDWWYVFM